jgi:hypothetical protein
VRILVNNPTLKRGACKKALIDETRLSAGVAHKKLKLLERSKTMLTERETRFLPGINAEISTRTT